MSSYEKKEVALEVLRLPVHDHIETADLRKRAVEILMESLKN